MSFRTATAAAIALTALGTAPVLAQNVFTGVQAVDDRIEDIQEDTADILEPDDADRFGFARAPQGWAGSVALATSATSGNTDTFDLTLGARLTYGAGVFSNYMGIGAEYSESDGSRDVAEAFAIYDGIYDLQNQFYGFGTARYNYNDDARSGTMHSSVRAPDTGSSTPMTLPGVFRPDRASDTSKTGPGTTRPNLPESRPHGSSPACPMWPS
jgi:putative salt-induced outer membrane protein YdiY